LIASGERKWGLMSGLVMLLPHGMEGMGPEHSSARLERFLELMDDNPYLPEFQSNDKRNIVLLSNMTVCNVTNPANYFHLLRRQLLRDFRKPLVVMTPKFLLRYKLAKSNISEFTDVKTFTHLYGETFPEEVDAAPEKIKKVIVSTGKVYYDLLEKRRELGIKVIF
jgi:2-oxoglutarate dehydrogenase E1 component